MKSLRILLFTISCVIIIAHLQASTSAAEKSRYGLNQADLVPDVERVFQQELSLSALHCAPLQPQTGTTITVSTETELRDRALYASAGTIILVAPGVYNMGSYVHIVNRGITLRGQSGDRDDVILDFGGMLGGHFGIFVEADDVTIADLTIRNTSDHGVSIQGVDRPILYNLHIQDTYDQLVKVNPIGDGSEDGLLACSRIEYTTTAPDDYTNGISAHLAHRWVVRDNQWVRIRGNNGSTGPTILFWSGSTETIVERNLIVDSYRGIAFGNPSHNYVDHTGGIVRNNMIYFSLEHDVAIEMTHAQGWLVAHNTALLKNPSPGLTWGMEARYTDSQGTFAYNLTNMNIWVDRDGAQGTVTGNLTNALSSWFADSLNADLHLLPTAADAIDQADTIMNVTDDYDGNIRPLGAAPDIGADEFGDITSRPSAVTDLVVSGILIPDAFHATLTWSAATDSVTTTIRYTYTHITDSNWEGAFLLTDSLPGDLDTYTADIPIVNEPVFIALKTQNFDGKWSRLSNNTFWPQRKTWLPIIFYNP